MNITKTTALNDEQLLHLIAKVIAWHEGEPLETIDQAATAVLYQDGAQQCAEDLRLV